MSSLTGSSNVENLSPQVLRQVAKEVAALAKTPLEGIKVYPNEEDITDIQASVEGPAGTPYAGGYFKVRLVLGKDFPRVPPKGYFLTKVFHPNVAANGEICVNTLKRDWKSDMGLKQLLLTIKCLLIYPNPESALNEEAGKLLLEQYEDYFTRAKMMTKIHAMSGKTSKESRCSEPCSSMAGSNSLGAGSKKHAGEKKLSAVDKRKKDKKKNLKRL
ncbi:putative ubiquitin-conjugating enzyme E2 S-like [Apostichopus japonicus]|uniref:E2 ubiquitin-conjugating enzyme n=1 Tax=Stichopus japonicus TaxID=307972 RepID=A0A2G8JR19_STIJA|nr:putative ubiquitin-conjugating enzyme E2 S-like [Apostichopus japonicus]